ncbi:MAG: RnfABCDGE type electron transport complex subunit C, partial [Clostridia bacterium]
MKFPGGVHPKEIGNGKASTRAKPVKTALPPDRVIIPLSQHIGAPCQCVVQVGQSVAMGQVIGQAKGVVSAPVHATVSGRVVEITPCMLANGISILSVIIDNDFEDRWDAALAPDPQIDQRTPKELAERVRDAGIVGMGGATFPTAVKLSPPEDKPIDTVILNGVECEPYLTADHRLMLEQPETVLDGLRFITKILSAKHAIIGIEQNKADAIEAMRKVTAGTDITVVALPVKYPQGGEKQLIYALTGRRVPNGALPMEVGVVVSNVAT